MSGVSARGSTGASPPSGVKLTAGFAAIYVVWGSTYLAIRFAVEEIPPFLMAGTRFLAAGLILYLWRRAWHGERPDARHWPGALVVGTLLFMGGNGSVVWSEQRVASGLTALILAVIPLWMVLLDATRRDGSPLTARVMLGIVLGMAGLFVLMEPSELLGAGRVDVPGAGVLMAGSFCWASGSLVSRRLREGPSAPMAAGMQMIAGGLVLIAAGVAWDEPARLDAALLSGRALASLAYLIVLGSVVGFTAYTWLLAVSSPARVATYAYVNPVVAVLLGWIFAGEPITPRTMLAAAIIVTAVAIIISARGNYGADRSGSSAWHSGPRRLGRQR